MDIICEMVTLLEERMYQLQILHAKIDEVAKMSIQSLNEAIERIQENCIWSHKQLDQMMNYQITDIQDFISNLELRLMLDADLMHESNVSFLDADTERKYTIYQHPAIDIKNCIMSCNFNYSKPVLNAWSVWSHESLKHSVQNFKFDNTYDVDIVMSDLKIETYVCNKDSGGVQVFDTLSGTYQRSIGHDLGPVFGLAILKSSRPLLFACSYLQSIISIFDAITGDFVRSIGKDILTNPWGICVRSSRAISKDNHFDSILYVADRGSHKMRAFDIITGACKLVIGNNKGSDVDQFSFPFYVTTFGGNESIKDPWLFVSDYGNHRVSVFHAETGAFVKALGGERGALPGQLNHPTGVAVSACDNISEPLLAVSEHDNHRIQIFNVVTGACVQCVGCLGSDRGQWRHPRGLRLVSHSQLEIIVCVADSKNDRVQLLVISVL